MAEKLTDTDVFYMEQAPEVIANKTGANVNDVFFAKQAPSKLAKLLKSQRILYFIISKLQICLLMNMLVRNLPHQLHL